MQPLATIALTIATTEPEAAVPVLYLAIAAAVAGDQDRATELISQALAARPASVTSTHAISGTRQPTWTSLRIDGTGVQALDTLWYSRQDDHFGVRAMLEWVRAAHGIVCASLSGAAAPACFQT